MIQKVKKLLFYITMVLLFFSSINLSADENIDILPIRSVPDLKAQASPGERNLSFNGMGTVQRIGTNEAGRKLIVIDDRLRYFAPDVKYYNTKGEIVSAIHVYEGKTVGYFVNDKREITGLYLKN
ncbi:MAG: hypothetical protein KKC20_12270 [Proteobacteria bacterium]|nr:hypothetical protein [Pseudomonadota bacterium]